MKYKTDLTSDEIDYKSITDIGIFERLTGERSEDEQKLQSYLQQRLGKGLILSTMTDVHAEFRMTELALSVRIESQIVIPWIERFFHDYSHRVISGEYPIHNPTQTIRISEVVLDTASRIKGVDELKSKIEKFFPEDMEH